MSPAVVQIPDDSIQPKPLGSMNSKSKSIYTQIYDNLVEKGRHLKGQWEPYENFYTADFFSRVNRRDDGS